MTDSLFLQSILIYLVFAVVLTWYGIRWARKFGPIKRRILVSGFYALFWGIGVDATGGEPGFALPAPNLYALLDMLSNGVYDGVLIGFIPVFIWWVFLYWIMYLFQ
ncbi:MAG TPA: hypothetical protein DIW47_10320 [Bacteroidetes bacterium]|nr:hypothetical protein [Bacteroidota bacterium]